MTEHKQLPAEQVADPTAETIAAIATPYGKGGVGIVRVSGPDAAAVLARLFRPQSGIAPQQMRSHQLYYGRIEDGQGQLLDQALAVFMAAPHSYTAEDVAEFQLHGGPRLLHAVLAAALAAGARLATPGEFTLRAFLHGRIDLSQAEAVMDIIEAKTPQAISLAAGQLEGRLAKYIQEVELALTDLLAEITVGVDFPDDEDAPQAERILPVLAAQMTQIKDHLLRGATQGVLAREGVRVALTGAVNVGKSSLLNRLLQSERAIVTELPGTTRDVIEETLEIAGIPFVLSDTAGFRSHSQADLVEQLGMARSEAVFLAAQLVLLVVDAAEGLTATSADLLQQTRHRNRLVLLNKSDLVTEAQLAELKQSLLDELPEADIVVVSAASGAGSQQLQQAMLRKVGAGLDLEASSPLVNNLRHITALEQALAALAAAVEGAEAGLPLDVVAIDIEQALTALGEISGKTVADAVLDTIFSRFCLGK